MLSFMARPLRIEYSGAVYHESAIHARHTVVTEDDSGVATGMA